MKTMQHVFTILIATLSITACSKWNQDPLAGQSDLLRDPQEAPREQEKPKDPESDASVRVDTVSFYNFSEGVSGEFEITARVLRSDYTYEILIDNIDAFPGAKYDPKSRKFSWNPPLGTVSQAAGNILHKTLKVIAYAVTPGGQRRFYNEKSVLISIDKTFGAPKIISAKMNQAKVREGDYALVTLEVTDMDAGPNAETWPTISVSPLKGKVNLAQYVRYQDTRIITNNRFEIALKLDLANAQIGVDYEDSGFAAIAISKNGIPSESVEVPVIIVSQLRDIDTTWQNRFDVTTTSVSVMQFSIFDPLGELKIDKPVFKDLPPEASIDCSQGSVGYSTQYCTFTWTPRPTTSPNAYLNFSADVAYSKKSYNDPLSSSAEFTFGLRVFNQAPTQKSKHLRGAK